MLKKKTEYSQLGLFEGKLLMDNFVPSLSQMYQGVSVFDPVSGKQEEDLCRINEEGDYAIMGYCVVNIKGTLYLVVPVLSVPMECHHCRIELWSFADPSSKPISTFRIRHDIYGTLCLCGDKLLFSNETKKTIDEFEVDDIPFKLTGVTIPTGIPEQGSMQSMFVLKEGGEKVIVLQYLADAGWCNSIIKGITFQGQELWKFGGLLSSPINGTLFQPFSICNDQEGNIFAAE